MGDSRPCVVVFANCVVHVGAENLEKTNTVMRQHFGMLNQWQANVQKYKAAKQREAATRSAKITKVSDGER